MITLVLRKPTLHRVRPSLTRTLFLAETRRYCWDGQHTCRRAADTRQHRLGVVYLTFLLTRAILMTSSPHFNAGGCDVGDVGPRKSLAELVAACDKTKDCDG